MTKVKISLNLDKDLLKKFDNLIILEERSRSSQIRKLILDYIKNKEK